MRINNYLLILMFMLVFSTPAYADMYSPPPSLFVTYGTLIMVPLVLSFWCTVAAFLLLRFIKSALKKKKNADDLYTSPAEGEAIFDEIEKTGFEKLPIASFDIKIDDQEKK